MFKAIVKSILAGSLVLGAMGIGMAGLAPGHAEAAANYYHTSGNRIVDSAGNPAVFNGINWFGFETPNYSPHGLWTRSMDDVLDQIQERGYNLIRLPYSNQMFDPGSAPNSIDYDKNPDLKGLTPIQIMDKLIEKAGDRGMKIFLDRHRPGSGGQSELWYTADYSEQRWIDDWKMLAKRYNGNDTVIGADLHNEPHGPASWGTGDPATDWQLAAERAGNAILSVNPHWLIIVEGIEKNVQGYSDGYWWGGNLKGVANHPVELDVPNQLVYSAHDYGPGVASQPWFSDPSFPDNMPAIWDAYWGYISKQNIAPVIVGEFGGRSVDMSSVEGIWQNRLVDYIGENELYWTYWCVNPNSGDTGGLLLDDWVTWNEPKQAMLDRIMQPLGEALPAAPGKLTATAGNGQISLNWSASAGAESYNVKRATVSGGPYTTVASGITGTAFTDRGLANGTAYYYVVSAVNSAGESGNSAEAAATPEEGSNAPDVNLVVQYKAADTNPTDNQIKPHFNIKNNGTTAVDLSGLKLRYYFSKDGTQSMSSWVDWAPIGAENIQRTFTDAYVELSFTAAAGSISAGGETGEIQLRMAKSDWSNFNEADDYSFDPTKTAYTDWDKVTLYLDDSLVWGVEPE